jgi:hypothetical protein
VRRTPEIGAALLLTSWDELSQSCISAGWDFDEPLDDEEEESDGSDDEFTLREDEDTNITADVEDVERVDQ